MLSATCDEFLKNICDCMDLAESNFGELLFAQCIMKFTKVPN